jgi:transcription antitermination factor NusG
MKTKNRRQRRYSPSTLTHRSGLRLIERHRVEIDRALSWHVVYCRAQQERVAERDLQAAGFTTYRPVQTFERLYRGKTSTVERAPVSRYVFVGLNAVDPDLARVEAVLTEDGWWPRMSGQVLHANGQPVRIGAGALQRFEDAVSCHFDGGLNGSGGAASGRSLFKVGETVFVRDGPFSGIPFSIESLTDYRVRGLVDLLGGKVAVDLELEQLEAAA